METNRQIREDALRILCLLDAQPLWQLQQAWSAFYHNLQYDQGFDEPARPMVPTPIDVQLAVKKLAGQVQEAKKEIDALIRSASQNWRLERMAWVDRNLLRLAAYELRSALHIPPNTIISDAVELAKRYSSEHAPAFVNGILDQIRRNVDR